MSRFDDKIKANLSGLIRGVTLLELFPGNDDDHADIHESTEFFFSLGLDVSTLGLGSYTSPAHHIQDVPPYPKLGHYDNIFINEPVWLWVVENGLDSCPRAGLDFLESHLDPNGKLLVTNYNSGEPEQIQKYMGGIYSLRKKNDIAIIEPILYR